MQPKENETPVELVICVQDLAEKWLKDCANLQAVVDALVKEQFVEVLLDDVKVWVKERKPGTSEEAGSLAEDYRQARKADLWTTTPKKGGQKSCYSCGQVGHLAKDCLRKKGIAPATSRGEDTSKTEKRRKEEKPLICYNCEGKGHTSHQCPSSAMFCKGKGISDNNPFWCKGVVEGQFVNDIVLDTGCSRTLVRSDLVGEENCKPGEKVTVPCTHGDIVTYPVASVELEVQGRVLTVEAAVSNQLPLSVLLGTDVPGLSVLLQSKSVNTALMAMTHSQTKRSQSNEANLREVSSVYKDTTPPVLTHEEDTTQGEDKQELGKLESELEKTASAVEAAEPRVTSPVVPRNNNWDEEYNFDDVMFIGGKNKKKVSRSEKREACCNHANTQNIVRSGFNLDISKPELRKLQDEDPMIQELKAKKS